MRCPTASIAPLRERLLAKLSTSTYMMRRSYVSSETLCALTSQESIAQELRQAGFDEHDSADTVVSVLQTCPKLFFILVLIGAVEYAVSLIRAGIVDTDLPLLAYSGDVNKYRVMIAIIQQQSMQSAFVEKQWYFMAPVFHGLGEHKELDQVQMLPMLSAAHILRSCGDADVQIVHVERSHLGATLQQATSVAPGTMVACAVKRTSAKRRFEVERELLRSCNLIAHAHIVTLLASFTWQEHFHILLPAAECNLRELWMRDLSLETRAEDVQLWTATQAHGLIEALAAIADGLQMHSVGSIHAIHGDLSASNILVFYTEASSNITTYVLKLADFDYSSWATSLDKIRFRGNYGSYVAPEIYLGSRAAPKCDVWSLGCLLLDFVTWSINGSIAVHELALARRQVDHGRSGEFANDFFFSTEIQLSGVVEPAHGLNKAVAKVLTNLLTTPCHGAAHDLLQTIRAHMLQVNATYRSLRPR